MQLMPLHSPALAIEAIERTTLAILAGGEGSRMGTPKGLLTIAGQPILQFLLDRLQWPGPTLLITAPGREHPPGWQRFTEEQQDPIAGGGPLRGVLTALEHVQTPTLIVLTVDMPSVGKPQCVAGLEALGQAAAATLGVMFRRPGPFGPQVEPFPLALRPEAQPTVAWRLKAARRSVHGLLEESGFVAVDAPAEWDEKVWTNLNEPGDLRDFTP